MVKIGLTFAEKVVNRERRHIYECECAWNVAGHVRGGGGQTIGATEQNSHGIVSNGDGDGDGEMKKI